MTSWIEDEGIDFQQAIVRLMEDTGVGRRQAIRYWIRGFEPLLSPRDRYRRAHGVRPRRRGSYVSWPSIHRQQS
jgi:hypothetical protein